MATEVTLPELGESVTEGTITGWLVEVGDTVEVDQPLFELSSDKIDTEVPSPAAGTLQEIKVEVDETVEVGTVVAVIGEGDADGGDETEDDTQEETADQAESEADESGTDGSDEADQADEADEAEQTSAEDDDAEASGGGEQTEVTLPELGESVTEGTITGWLVEVGDTVEVDQPLFELSSDKIDTEVPSPAAGTLQEIKVEVDETVEVGTVVAIIGSGDGGGSSADTETSEDEEAHDDGGEEETDAEQQQATEQQTEEPSGNGEGVLASPLVRKIAREEGVDLGSLSGSGQGGRVTREDVEAAASSGSDGEQAADETDETEERQKSSGKTEEKQPQKSSEPQREVTLEAGERERVEDLSRIRQRIAAKMMESMQGSAQLTTIQEADVTAIMKLRAQHKDAFKEREGASLSPFAFLCRAALLALPNHPTVNAQADWDAGQMKFHDYVNLGIAVDTEKGLIVPNVKNADDLTLAALARAIADAASKARGKGQLAMQDIQGGTFTVTNTGSRGVLIDTPILNYPEVAIMATAAIQKRPVVIDDNGSPAIAIRDMVYLCLTYDHRLIDGADAARFVSEVAEIVETRDWAAEIGQ